MSLQKCPHCKHKISYSKIYKKLNTKRFDSESHLVKCPNCKHKLGFTPMKKSLLHKITVGFLWMAVPLYLIGMVATSRLDPITAILSVILYHFVAMHLIIMFHRYSSVKK